ncbi:MAG: hypothetical protein FJX57_21060, partial [Alphaproteobacteria bacterium]|nr:hypothetical protein [Alphaproteobacteria bacterium]
MQTVTEDELLRLAHGRATAGLRRGFPIDRLELNRMAAEALAEATRRGALEVIGIRRFDIPRVAAGPWMPEPHRPAASTTATADAGNENARPSRPEAIPWMDGLERNAAAHGLSPFRGGPRHAAAGR